MIKHSDHFLAPPGVVVRCVEQQNERTTLTTENIHRDTPPPSGGFACTLPCQRTLYIPVENDYGVRSTHAARKHCRYDNLERLQLMITVISPNTTCSSTALPLEDIYDSRVKLALPLPLTLPLQQHDAYFGVIRNLALYHLNHSICICIIADDHLRVLRAVVHSSIDISDRMASTAALLAPLRRKTTWLLPPPQALKTNPQSAASPSPVLDMLPPLPGSLCLRWSSVVE